MQSVGSSSCVYWVWFAMFCWCWRSQGSIADWGLGVVSYCDVVKHHLLLAFWKRQICMELQWLYMSLTNKRSSRRPDKGSFFNSFLCNILQPKLRLVPCFEKLVACSYQGWIVFFPPPSPPQAIRLPRSLALVGCYFLSSAWDGEIMWSLKMWCKVSASSYWKAFLASIDS